MFIFQFKAPGQKDNAEKLMQNINGSSLESAFTLAFANFKTANAYGGDANMQIFDATKFSGSVSIGVAFSSSGTPVTVTHIKGTYEGKPVESVQIDSGTVAVNNMGKYSLPAAEYELNSVSYATGAGQMAVDLKRKTASIATKEFSKADENILLTVNFVNGNSTNSTGPHTLGTEFETLLAASTNPDAKRALAYKKYDVGSLAYVVERTKKPGKTMDVCQDAQGTYTLQVPGKEPLQGSALVGMIMPSGKEIFGAQPGELIPFSIGKRKYVFEPVPPDFGKQVTSTEGPMK